MPHSSGGGSSGGGSSGGRSGGSSTSKTYFAGAHRYRVFNQRSGAEFYIYSRSQPGKTGISSLILVGVFSVCFFLFALFAASVSAPKKLKPVYSDKAAVHDDAELFAKEDTLVDTLEEYRKLTGICPVVYTVYSSAWSGRYESLEDYTFDKYVNNFSDEQHFVIVYSVPDEEAVLYREGKLSKTGFVWHAVQGNETDPIITEAMFDKFGNLFQDQLMEGVEPSVALNEAFELALKDAESKLDPDMAKTQKIQDYALALSIVFVVCGGVFAYTIYNYRKQKSMVYEEVPLTDEDYALSSQVSHASGAAQTARTVTSIIFLVPFAAVGICLLYFRLRESVRGNDAGKILLVFGIMWSTLIVVCMISIIKKFVRAKNKTAPITREQYYAQHPRASTPAGAEVEDTEYADVNPFVPAPESQNMRMSSTNAVPVEPDYSEFDSEYFKNKDKD